MFCPYCNSPKIRVVDKRGTDENRAVRRRRECLKCKSRFTTYERVRGPLVVIKRNGKREKFDREKIKSGMMKAIKERPIGPKKIEKMLDEIEEEIKGMNCTQIKSKVIGDLVVEKLKRIDKVAFVRFMSYYKQYNDVKSFKKELGSG